LIISHCNFESIAIFEVLQQPLMACAAIILLFTPYLARSALTFYLRFAPAPLAGATALTGGLYRRHTSPHSSNPLRVADILGAAITLLFTFYFLLFTLYLARSVITPYLLAVLPAILCARHEAPPRLSQESC
jgi:hypothetical protein